MRSAIGYGLLVRILRKYRKTVLYGEFYATQADMVAFYETALDTARVANVGDPM